MKHDAQQVKVGCGQQCFSINFICVVSVLYMKQKLRCNKLKLLRLWFEYSFLLCHLLEETRRSQESTGSSIPIKQYTASVAQSARRNSCAFFGRKALLHWPLRVKYDWEFHTWCQRLLSLLLCRPRQWVWHSTRSKAAGTAGLSTSMSNLFPYQQQQKTMTGEARYVPSASYSQTTPVVFIRLSWRYHIVELKSLLWPQCHPHSLLHWAQYQLWLTYTCFFDAFAKKILLFEMAVLWMLNLLVVHDLLLKNPWCKNEWGVFFQYEISSNTDINNTPTASTPSVNMHIAVCCMTLCLNGFGFTHSCRKWHAVLFQASVARQHILHS